MSELIHVLIADDHELVRSGLRTVIRGQADFSVVGEARDGLEAIAEAHRLKPELVVMDVRMPKMNGIEACREIRDQDPAINVLILTSFGDEQAVMAAIVAGAGGFMLKDAPPSQLAEAVRTVAAGEALLAPAVTRRVVERWVRRPVPDAAASAALDRLTEREHEVLLQVAAGLSNAEVATALFLSEATVKTHVTRVLAKLGLRDRVQAVVFAYEHGLVEPGGRAVRA